jgi:UDP-N-acetyl-D-galactosamine dehydrogenase
MGLFVANKLVKLLIQKGKKIGGAKTLMLGITFKENCPDIRNSRVVDIYRELSDFGMEVDVYDPWANKAEVKKEHGIDLVADLGAKYDAIVLTVAHQEFLNLPYARLKAENGIIFDIKSVLDRTLVDARL